jgi:UDP-glucose:(heptosyl)LPS alpha-1,3-glucosyltransferase
MRVAIIKSNYTPFGGGEKYAYYLVNAFANRGYITDVLTAEKKEWVTGTLINRVLIYRAPFNNLLKLYTFNKGVVSYLKTHLNEYDCILDMDRTTLHTHIRAGGGSHKGWIERRKKISPPYKKLSFQINPFHRYMLKIEEQGLKNPYLKKLICISHMVKNDFLKYYDFDEQKIEVVHNGVEWESFDKPFRESLEQVNIIRKSLGLKGDNFYFLYVGSGYERKGLKEAIAALRYLPDYVDLLVVGKDKNEHKYKIMSEKLGLGKRIHFFGPQRNVIPFFQISDAFILPTIYDPFSNASLEALAMGLYTVTSSANGCSEVIKDEAGYIIKDLRIIDSIIEAMRTALNKHLSKREIRESVKHLNFSIQLNKIVDICISDMEVIR